MHSSLRPRSRRIRISSKRRESDGAALSGPLFEDGLSAGSGVASMG